jgi:hypothetical protein
MRREGEEEKDGVTVKRRDGDDSGCVSDMVHLAELMSLFQKRLLGYGADLALTAHRTPRGRATLPTARTVEIMEDERERERWE